MGATLDEEFENLPEEIKVYLAPLFDAKSDTSLAKRMPGGYALELLRLAVKDPELLPLLGDEDALKKEIRARYSYVPTTNDGRLKYLFHQELENSIYENRQMIMTNVHSLVCAPNAFKHLFFKLPYRAIWLLCRPQAHQTVLKEMLTHGFGRLREILDLPDHDEKGRLNLKLLELKTKIIGMVDMRLHGAPAQKILQHTHHTGTVTSKDKSEIQAMVKKGDMHTIQNRLAEIAAEARRIEGRDSPPKKEPLILEAEVVAVPQPKNN